jgi:preprotein translocase subunit SecD
VTNKIKKNLIIVLVVLAIAVLALLPTFSKELTPEHWFSQPIKLGLDLRGGSYLVLGVETNEAIKSQIRSIGTAVASEMRKKRAGVLSARANAAEELEVTLISKSGLSTLEEYMSDEYPELRRLDQSDQGENRVSVKYGFSEKSVLEIEKNAIEQAIETIRNRVDQFGVSEPVIQRSGTNRIMVQLPDVTDLERVKKTIGSVAKLEFRLVHETPGSPNTVSLRQRDGGSLYVQDEPVMTGDAISGAAVEINPQTNEVAVSLKLNSVGASTFDKITADNVGKRLAVVLDNVVQSAPVIRSRISGGIAQITGSFSTEEARALAIVLRSGALPAPLTFEEERTVGASLGADSIRKGIYSTLIGTLVVVVFMVIYYRKSGLMAVVCLGLNFLLLMAALALLGATLTLPGIAGLALTIGMAVDANVIIYERIREELRAGSAPHASMLAGFSKAHWTILDANITTLLTGLILYNFGTGPIKGFAVTLCLGILSSLFAALFISRVGFEVFKLRDNKGSLSI